MQISVSRLRVFKSCRRLYQLRYVEGLKPAKRAEALEVGSNYHAILEALYNNGTLPVATDFSKEHAMAAAYAKYIYPHFKVKAAEVKLTCELETGDTLVGIADGIAEDGCLVEHKTTGMEITEQYEYNLLWDEQILAYMLATGARKVWYTVCRKPTIRQKNEETDKDFFNRMVEWYDIDTDKKIRLLTVTRTDEEVDAFYRELCLMAEEMRQTEKAEHFYKNTYHCNAWGRRCEYSSICINYDPAMDYVDFVRREEVDSNGDSDPKF